MVDKMLKLFLWIGLCIGACSGDDSDTTHTHSGGGESTDSSIGSGGNGSSNATSSETGTSSTSTTGSGGSSDCPLEPSGEVQALTITEIAYFDRPVFLTSAPGEESKLFVLEQHEGTIRIIENGETLSEPFLDLGECENEISCQDEQGLLGLAFHPGYENNGRFFVNYTNGNGDTVIAEYRRSSDPNIAEEAAVQVLLTIEQPDTNHNGGMIAFGSDGYLYIGMGDGGGADDPDERAQNLDELLGKILRIDVDNYPTPPTGNIGNSDIWDYGLRNPWRFSFDRCTGDLYIGDVGQNNYEEIDVELLGNGNLNYGWDIMEASACHEPNEGCDTTNLTFPVAEYSHDDGCSVTGGYVYRGHNIPGLVGTYLYGDYCSGSIWGFSYSDGSVNGFTEWTDEILGDNHLNISSFGQDNDGELYVLDLAGSVYRINPE